MLKIKLSKFGKRNQPHYRVVLNEAQNKRDGSYVENIGHYAPSQSPKLLEIDMVRYEYWIGKGAVPTPTVAFLAEIVKSGKGFPKKKAQPNRKAKLKEKAAAKVAEPTSKPEVAQEKVADKTEEKVEDKVEVKSEEKLAPEAVKETTKEEVKTETKPEVKEDKTAQ